ncbi:hypothetical protein H4219_001505 [Mycoemilia scoparia]|uniref:Ferrochelatase n=1 Tax=Mycoemilia scoparia TaxID=417184 RepID=A0A9W8DVM3_9FUNG|nr:hypothetical protein H4219_001505 [Mycoemilia scoparia]
MGGPRTTMDVKDYLERIFLDRDIMQLPAQKLLGSFLAKMRVKKVKHEYDLIGGGSPIEKWTNHQGSEMVKLLDQLSPETAPHKHYVAFRYSDPLTSDAMEEIMSDNVKRVVAFSQYPQYSCSTTGSNLNELYRQAKKYDPKNTIKWSVIDRWGNNPLFIEAMANNIELEVKKIDPSWRDSTPILFSAHSLPLQVVDRGDPYIAEVCSSSLMIISELRKRGIVNPYRVIWQSAVGPLRWMGPQTEDVIEQCAKRGHKALVLVPVAFTSDHIETLSELDIEYCELAKEHGVQQFLRVPAMNGNSTFIKGLAETVKEHLDLTSVSNKINYQLYERCPGCDFEQCSITKNFFRNQCEKATGSPS